MSGHKYEFSDARLKIHFSVDKMKVCSSLSPANCNSKLLGLILRQGVARLVLIEKVIRHPMYLRMPV